MTARWAFGVVLATVAGWAFFVAARADDLGEWLDAWARALQLGRP